MYITKANCCELLKIRLTEEILVMTREPTAREGRRASDMIESEEDEWNF